MSRLKCSFLWCVSFLLKIGILIFQYKVKSCKSLLKIQIRYIGFSSTQEAKAAACSFRNPDRKEICSFTLRESRTVSYFVWALEKRVGELQDHVEKKLNLTYGPFTLREHLHAS